MCSHNYFLFLLGDRFESLVQNMSPIYGKLRLVSDPGCKVWAKLTITQSEHACTVYTLWSELRNFRWLGKRVSTVASCTKCFVLVHHCLYSFQRVEGTFLMRDDTKMKSEKRHNTSFSSNSVQYCFLTKSREKGGTANIACRPRYKLFCLLVFCSKK